LVTNWRRPAGYLFSGITRASVLLAVIGLMLTVVVRTQGLTPQVQVQLITVREARVLEERARGFVYYSTIWLDTDRVLWLRVFTSEYLLDLDSHSTTIAFRLSG
jgi:hypothetical protein